MNGVSIYQNINRKNNTSLNLKKLVIDSTRKYATLQDFIVILVIHYVFLNV